MLHLNAELMLRNSEFSTVLSHERASRIVLAVPHDTLIGNDFLGLFERRKNGIRWPDKYVWPIVLDAILLADKAGVRIDAVRFLFPRTFIDANREAPGTQNIDPDTRGQTAYDDQRLASVYDHYHGTIDWLIERSCRVFGRERVLFMDMHGFRAQPERLAPETFDLILGTANRTTIHHNDVDRSLAEHMRGKGYRVFLPAERPVCPNGDPYRAGHTTKYYAKHFSVNAVQVEIDRRFRVREGEADGKRLAADLAEFFVSNYT